METAGLQGYMIRMRFRPGLIYGVEGLPAGCYQGTQGMEKKMKTTTSSVYGLRFRAEGDGH